MTSIYTRNIPTKLLLIHYYHPLAHIINKSSFSYGVQPKSDLGLHQFLPPVHSAQHASQILILMALKFSHPLISSFVCLWTLFPPSIYIKHSIRQDFYHFQLWWCVQSRAIYIITNSLFTFDIRWVSLCILYNIYGESITLL